MRKPSPHPNPLLRRLIFIGGWLAVVLGVIGLLLPVVPTAPFLILAAYCFLNSSPRFYHWLVEHRVFGLYVRYYLSGQGMPERAKLMAVGMLWLMMLITALWIIDSEWLSALLLTIALAVSIYIAALPEPVETVARRRKR